MVLLDIVGMREGNRPFSLTVPASGVTGLPPEFDNDVHIEGRVHKSGRHYVVDATVSADGTFVCDRSLESFRELIAADLHVEFIIDPSLAVQQQAIGAELDDEQERGIGEDDKTLDITEDVRQVLTVAIPMQHIAPAYRDVPLEEIYPALKPSTDGEAPVDDRWAALQQLKRK
ncbi:MAG: DUF177 domain-containing protein [Candidatus Kapabacteria bacterium]|nr:DUF177 domain-containing protein [Candidatus Kapabacteria bacterium]